MPNYFDDWEGEEYLTCAALIDFTRTELRCRLILGYFAARERFLQALAEAEGTAVVYGGDSHNAWASEHFSIDGTTICAEYDTTSVCPLA